MTDSTEPLTRAQQFGQYVATAARAAGYDIDSPRGGGKKALAVASGMSHASVSRMLGGQTIPDPSFFEALAIALRKPVAELLVRSGLISAGALMKPDVLEHPLSAKEVAEQLGIVSEDNIAAFEAMVRALAGGSESHSDISGSGSRRSA